MNERNKPSCGKQLGNSGIPGCDFLPGRPIGLILVPKGKEYSKEESDDLIDTLKRDAQGPIRDRVYPIGPFGTMEDNSTDPTEDSLGVGFDVIVDEGAYKFTFPLVNGKACYAKNLRKFNGDTYDAFMVLDNALIGTEAKSGNLRPFTMSRFYLAAPTLATDTTVARYNVTVQFPKKSEFVDSLGFIETTDDMLYEIKGNLEYNIIPLSQTAEALTIDIVEKCSQQSILEVYGDELADKTLWNGVTAVTYADGKLTLTGSFKNGDKVSVAGPDTLAGKGIGGSPQNGVEILPLTVKLP